MLRCILDELTDTIKTTGFNDVYTIFDNIPVNKKGSCYIIAGIEGLEFSIPVFSQYNVYMPFSAKTVVSLAASPDTSAEKLYSAFEQYILKALDNADNLNCRLKSLSVKNDRNLRRLILRSEFEVSGIRITERE